MIYVIRHGEVQSNIDGIISGWNDESLTDKGVEQAIKMRDELQDINFDIIYSSPVLRAKQTALIVALNENIIYDERLSERNPGAMLGKSRKTIDKDVWNSLEVVVGPDGFETLGVGLKRVSSILDEIHTNYLNKNVLIVTHNFISKCIWMIENNIYDKELISGFIHNHGEVKCYENKLLKKL